MILIFTNQLAYIANFPLLNEISMQKKVEKHQV